MPHSVSLFYTYELRRFKTRKDAKMTLQGKVDHGSSSRRPVLIKIVPGDLEGSG